MQQSARKIILSGVVQGVGFRPFIYRHAQLNKLTGWVRNSSGRVEVHVQGELQFLDQFENGRPSYSLGLQYEVPIGNRLACSRLQRRRVEMRRLQSESVSSDTAER